MDGYVPRCPLYLGGQCGTVMYSLEVVFLMGCTSLTTRARHQVPSYKVSWAQLSLQGRSRQHHVFSSTLSSASGTGCPRSREEDSFNTSGVSQGCPYYNLSITVRIINFDLKRLLEVQLVSLGTLNLHQVSRGGRYLDRYSRVGIRCGFDHCLILLCY